MEWTAPIDAYCERLGPGFWAEPFNAVTNLAFLVAAALMWRRLRGQNLPLARALTIVLALIGLGSFLFHTLATAWAGGADVLPIGLFVIIYINAACRDYLRLSAGRAYLATVFWFGFVVAVAWLLGLAAPALAANASYIAVDLLILGFGVGFIFTDRQLGGGLLAGGVLLGLSITARMLDMPLCGIWPTGTHLLWHVINAAVLGWMIEVYRRHMLAGGPARG